MKEGSWGYLKQELCPQEKWLKDSEQTHCHFCNKEFRFMVRRRHHCRSCGKIFCSACSNYWINGKYIDSSLDSRLRLCQYCHKKIMESSKDLNRRNYQQNSQATTDKPNTNSDDEEEGEQDGYGTYNDVQHELSLQNEHLEKFNQHVAQELKAVAHHLCEINNIEQRWAPQLARIVLKATTDTKIDTLYTNLLMDITQYVKIKRVQTSQQGVTRVFRGYAATKNVMNKHMETNFVNPKVIIVTPSVEMSSLQSSSEAIKFQEIVSQEKSYLKKIMDKLLKFNPHIVFVENTINIVALEYLQSKRVTVVSKLKPKVVDNIRRVTKLRKKIEKLYYFNKLQADQVVGTCRRIYFQRFQHENEGKTIMFLEDDESPVASIILADPDIDKLTCLKKITRRLLKVCRQLLLERYLIEADVCHFNKNRADAIGYFDDFLDRQYDGVEQFLKKKSISLSKLNFVRCHFSNLADIGKQISLEQYFKVLPYQREWAFSYESDLCFQPEYKTRKFYSKDPTVDIPLGRYLLQKVSNIDKKCTSCGRPKYNHNSIFYHGRSMIRVEVFENKFNAFKAIVGLIDEPVDEQPTNLVITKERVQMQLRDNTKSTLTPKEHISSYFECEDCQVKLCDPIQLKRCYLENSFLFFILKLSTTVRSGSQQILHIPEEAEGKCVHQRRARVFQYQDTLIKFIVQPLRIYRLNEICLTDTRSKLYIEELERVFLEGLFGSQLRPIQKACDSLMDHLNRLSALYGGDLNPRRYGRISDVLIKLKDILARILQQMDELTKKQSTKNRIDFDYTILKRECHNYYLFFENMLKVAVQLDTKLRKSSRREDTSPSQNFEQQVNVSVQDMNEVVSTTQSILPDLTFKHADLMNIVSSMPERFTEMRWALEESAQFTYVPLYKEDPISFIVFALNSKSFAVQAETNSRQIKIKVGLQGQTMPQGTIRKSLEELMDTLKVQVRHKDYKDQLYQVTVYHHSEFEQIRNSEGIVFKDFLRAMLGCSSWDNTGGKSGSKFAKSYNETIVMKFINDKEFEQFQKFARSYIEYVKEAKLAGTDSLLAKIFGIFEVNVKGKTCNCVVMQNIFFRLNMKKVIVYDLKGSEANRFASPKGKSFTGLDTNFKVDRNSSPLSLPAQLHDRVLATLQNDCNFLGKQQVIDYSLLLIINEEDSQVRMGIIDFMRPYHLFEKLESLYKEIKLSATPTVIPPKLYSDRFMQAMKHYFLRISND